MHIRDNGGPRYYRVISMLVCKRSEGECREKRRALWTSLQKPLDAARDVRAKGTISVPLFYQTVKSWTSTFRIKPFILSQKFSAQNSFRIDVTFIIRIDKFRNCAHVWWDYQRIPRIVILSRICYITARFYAWEKYFDIQLYRRTGFIRCKCSGIH